jgi:hypothetical protein
MQCSCLVEDTGFLKKLSRAARAPAQLLDVANRPAQPIVARRRSEALRPHG